MFFLYSQCIYNICLHDVHVGQRQKLGQQTHCIRPSRLFLLRRENDILESIDFNQKLAFLNVGVNVIKIKMKYIHEL